MTIARRAVLGGADAGVAVETFGRAKEGWLRASPALPGGIPSHATFGRVFARPDPEQSRACFAARVRAVAGAEVAAGAVAIDGTAARRSRDRGKGKAALHPVSARATAGGPVPGRAATDEGSSQITAIPAPLRLLDPEDRTVTIDAMGCRAAIAAQIVEPRADYVPALKGNHEALHERARPAFADAPAPATPPGTSPSSATSPSACSAAIRPRAASPPSAPGPPSTPAVSARPSPDCRRDGTGDCPEPCCQTCGDDGSGHPG